MTECKYIAYCNSLDEEGEMIFMGDELDAICESIDLWHEALTDSWTKSDLNEDHILSGNYKFLLYKRSTAPTTKNNNIRIVH